MSQYENDLEKLEAAETIPNSDYQFETPFRAIVFGTYLKKLQYFEK